MYVTVFVRNAVNLTQPLTKAQNSGTGIKFLNLVLNVLFRAPKKAF
jgi:hypothetical protein